MRVMSTPPMAWMKKKIKKGMSSYREINLRLLFEKSSRILFSLYDFLLFVEIYETYMLENICSILFSSIIP